MLSRSTRISLMLCINGAFFLAELSIGYAVNSLALVTDSFHMLNDMLSLGVALWAIKVAARTQANARYSYGWQRAEILGALINGVFLLALCFTIALEAIQRMVKPEPVTNPLLVLITGAAGFVGNLVGLVLFHEHGHSHGHGHDHHHHHDHHSEEEYQSKGDEEKHDMHHHDGGHFNMKSIFLHVLGDALGNVGVMITALIIWLTNYSWRFYVDSIVSFVIAIIIFVSAFPLVKQTSFILLQGVPTSIPIQELREQLNKMSGVLSVHELHVWQLSDTKIIGSLHVLVSNETNYMSLATEIRQLFHVYGIHSVTIQPEYMSPDKKSVSFNMSSTDVETLVLMDPNEVPVASACNSEVQTSESAENMAANPGPMEIISDDAIPSADLEQVCLLRCKETSCQESTCCPPPVSADSALPTSSSSTPPS